MSGWLVLAGPGFCDRLGDVVSGRGLTPVMRSVPTMAQAFSVVARMRPEVIVLPVSVSDLASTDAFRLFHGAAPVARIVVLPRRHGPTGDGADGATEPVWPAAQMAVVGVRTLRNGASSAGEARCLVGRVCAEADEHQLTDDAAVVASELVSNAVTHAHTALGLGVWARPGAVRIEVRDGHREPPSPRCAEDSDDGGRGLMLVDALSSAWGVDPSRSGKTVWAQLDSETFVDDRQGPGGSAGAVDRVPLRLV